jgi:hypothetical protein
MTESEKIIDKAKKAERFSQELVWNFLDRLDFIPAPIVLADLHAVVQWHFARDETDVLTDEFLLNEILKRNRFYGHEGEEG